MKSHLFDKCSHHIFLYIVGYNNISWRPHETPSQNRGVVTSTTGFDAYVEIDHSLI